MVLSLLSPLMAGGLRVDSALLLFLLHVQGAHVSSNIPKPSFRFGNTKIQAHFILKCVSRILQGCTFGTRSGFLLGPLVLTLLAASCSEVPESHCWYRLEIAG